MAYNEERCIGGLLDALLKQKVTTCSIERIVVVASGCTDRTAEIAEEFCLRDPRVKLIVEEERQGKAAAVNLFLASDDSEIVVLESGDTLPEEDTIERLLRPFVNPDVGMVGGHPVPLNEPNNFIGYAVNLLWRLHHRIAQRNPKCGEVVAFRKVIHEIDHFSAVDEACLESLIKEAGLRLAYAPDAIVRNLGPENLEDFIVQRRRIAAGHSRLQREGGYSVATTSPFRILGVLLSELEFRPKPLMWALGTIILEAYCRVLGFTDYAFRNKEHYIWDVVKSTKQDLTRV